MNELGGNMDSYQLSLLQDDEQNVYTLLQSASETSNDELCSEYELRTHSFHKSLIGVKAGSVRASVLASVSSALGAGMLTMPYATKNAGLIFSVCMIIISAIVSGISMSILLESVKRLRCDTYSGLARRLISPSAGVVVDAVISLNGILLGAVFLIFLADFIGDLLSLIFGNPVRFHESDTRTIIIILAVIATFPLSAQATYGKLRYMAVAYISSIIFTIIIVTIKAPTFYDKIKSVKTNHQDLRNNTISVPLQNSFKWFSYGLVGNCQAFNIFLFGFTQHQNIIPIAKDMTIHTLHKYKQVVVNTISLESVIYATLSISGYMSFLDTTKENFINNYPPKDILIILCRSLLSFCLLFAIPMAMISSGISLRRLIKRIYKYVYRRLYNSGQQYSLEIINPIPAIDNANPCLQQVALVSNENYRQQMKTCRRILSIAIVLAIDSVIAIKTREVATIVSLCGGVFSVCLMCGIPLLLYMKGVGQNHKKCYQAIIVLALGGTFLMGLIFSILIVNIAK